MFSLLRQMELLTPLEQQLYEAEDLFFAGIYQDSYKALQDILPQTENNPLYFKLGCIYYLCIAAVFNSDCDGFTAYAAEMNAILKQEFPYKK